MFSMSSIEDYERTRLLLDVLGHVGGGVVVELKFR